MTPDGRLPLECTGAPGGGLVLRLPRARPAMPPLLPLMLLAALLGLAFGAFMLRRGPAYAGARSLWAVWIAGWCGALLGMLGTARWAMMGRASVRVDGDTLTLEYAAAGIVRRRSYDLGDVEHLRTVPQTRWELKRGAMAPFGSRRWGALAFEYRGRTVRWGGGLETHEAAEVLRALAGSVCGGSTAIAR